MFIRRCFKVKVSLFPGTLHLVAMRSFCSVNHVQLREAGVAPDAIQIGRAKDDDETWLDVLEAEDDVW